MALQDYLTVMDKQQWRMLQNYYDTNGQSRQALKVQCFLLNANFMVIRLRDCCGKDSSRKFKWNLDGEKVPSWECLFVHRKQGLFSSVSVDCIKMAEKTQNMAPMWTKIMNNVDIDEPTSFLDHVHLGCSQRE